MKRFLEIFLLYAQHALEYKSRSIVWFLLVVLDAGVYLLYWRGVLTGPDASAIWTLPKAMSYYLLLLVAGSFLQVHIEEEMAFEDIQYGRLSQYLLRPFPYIGFKFFQELPWRIIQGSFGVLTLIGISLYITRIELISDPWAIPLVLLIALSAYVLCFIYKMIVGSLAFWTIDYSGLDNIQTIIFMLFSGILIPLNLLPEFIREFALRQPIAYMLYYPVLAAQGEFGIPELWRVLGTQWIWICGAYVVFRILWKNGLRTFTAVGQ